MKPYKGYVGVARVDAEAGVIRGKVINTRDTITFQGQTVPEAEQAFHDSVDDYLEEGVEPERPFSGKFPVRTSPRLHRAVSLAAGRQGISLNEYVERALIRAVRKPGQRDDQATASKAAPSAPLPRAARTRPRAKA
jgi:predicted HicB family RNase H-like nuclease